MWTEEYSLCPWCGGEVRLVTDGRLAYADAEPVLGSAASRGWTRLIWRDGMDVVVSCPVLPDHCEPFSCGGEVRFHGEGTITNQHPSVEHLAVPIHDQVP